MENSIFIALLALLVVILGPLGNAFLEQRRLGEERHETRLLWRRDFIHAKMMSLIELRAQLQYLQDKLRGSYWESVFSVEELHELDRKRETAYAKAFGIMLTIPLAKIRGKAGQVMDPVQNWEQNEKIEAINEAIRELGNLLDKAMGETERLTYLK